MLEVAFSAIHKAENPLTDVYVVTGNTVAANHDLNLRQ
jgi:hypothetical protein